jgi:alkane 1-monooxygenase
LGAGDSWLDYRFVFIFSVSLCIRRFAFTPAARLLRDGAEKDEGFPRGARETMVVRHKWSQLGWPVSMPKGKPSTFSGTSLSRRVGSVKQLVVLLKIKHCKTHTVDTNLSSANPQPVAKYRAMRFSDLRFLLALLLPALAGFGLIVAPQNAFVSTLIVWWGMALLEVVMPKTSPAPVASDASLGYFRWVLRVYVLLQITLILLGAWAAASANWLLVLGIAFSVGYITGAQGITFAHELGHSKSKIDRFCGWLLMSSVCYGHFMVEHYRGHHPRAATFDDAASARYGESFYRFLPRTLWGSFSSGWRLEAQRIVQMKSSWSKSPLVWSSMGSVAMLGMPLLMLFMPLAGYEPAQAAIKIVAYLALQSIIAFLLLELVNYIEHYGLQRKTEGNKREAFGQMHAWNADHVITNSLLANLQRHSDHHMHAWKPYGTLQDMPEAPRLPTGYAGSIILAAIPPLWFAVMHPKLEALKRRVSPAAA